VTLLCRSGRRRGAAGLSCWFLLGLLALAGCAKVESPSGGPLDADAPIVASTYPDSGATGMADLDSLVITFSEPMNRRSVETAFQIVPDVEFSRLEWKDEVWTLRLRSPLLPHSTYVAFVGADAEDRLHNK